MTRVVSNFVLFAAFTLLGTSGGLVYGACAVQCHQRHFWRFTEGCFEYESNYAAIGLAWTGSNVQRYCGSGISYRRLNGCDEDACAVWPSINPTAAKNPVVGNWNWLPTQDCDCYPDD